MAKRPKGKKPATGQRIKYVTWYDPKNPDTSDELMYGWVTQLLSSQFVVQPENPEHPVMMQFYSDYGFTWKEANGIRTTSKAATSGSSTKE